MGTKFSEIYDRAVFKFTDYTFITAITDFKEAVMQKYLLSASVDFQPVCDMDLTQYDLEQEAFNVVLGNEEIEILSLGIAYYWLSSQVMNRELLKNRIHNKDYTVYSPANLLKELVSLRDTIDSDYKGRINTYSYRHSDIENLKV